MAVGYVNHIAEIGAAATSVTTASFTAPSGNYVILSFNTSTSQTTATVSDSLGGTWVNIARNVGGSRRADLWIRSTVSNGSAMTITFTYSTQRPAVYFVSSLSGANGTYSTVVSGSGTTTIPSVTTSASTSVGDLYYATVGIGRTSGSTFTPGSGWTAGGTTVFTQSGAGFEEYLVASSIGTATAAATFGGVMSSSVIASVVFRAAPSVTKFTGWGIPLV